MDYPLIFCNNRFYDADGEVSEETLAYKIYKAVIPYVKSNVAAVVKRLFEALKLYCFSEPLAPKEDEIHLLNGVLKTDGTWIPEKKFCANRLNINYDPEIRNGAYYPENFLSFLSDMLDADDITTLQEYLGYCLIPSTRGQAMLFIIGNGGEGKSRIGVVLQEIFKSSMITGCFQRIETDRFFRYNLQNKLLMLDDDMQMNALSSTGYIKNLITAEIPVDVEAKGQQSQQAMLYSRFLCFGNGSPKALYDKSDGFARRMIILTTKPVPENRKIDPFLADKFIAERRRYSVGCLTDCGGLFGIISDLQSPRKQDGTYPRLCPITATFPNFWWTGAIFLLAADIRKAPRLSIPLMWIGVTKI